MTEPTTKGSPKALALAGQVTAKLARGLLDKHELPPHPAFYEGSRVKLCGRFVGCLFGVRRFGFVVRCWPRWSVVARRRYHLLSVPAKRDT
jgi:hypothetical protein